MDRAPRGVPDPRAGERWFDLEIRPPSAELAELVEQYWTVRWDLRDRHRHHQHTCRTRRSTWPWRPVGPEWVIQRYRLHEAAERLAEEGDDPRCPRKDERQSRRARISKP
jgi:hypothetical protein